MGNMAASSITAPFSCYRFPINSLTSGLQNQVLRLAEKKTQLDIARKHQAFGLGVFI